MLGLSLRMGKMKVPPLGVQCPLGLEVFKYAACEHCSVNLKHEYLDLIG